MASRQCWYCETKAHMELIVQSVKTKSRTGLEGGSLIYGAFVCNECSMMSIGIAVWPEGRGHLGDPHAFLNTHDDLLWLPPKGYGREFEDVPQHIAEAASEAHECLSIGALRATTLMARSVVEATAKDKGITKGSLMNKIDEMRKQDLVREYVKEAAHEIRHFGNDMAHGDFIEPVTREEAEEVLTLMGEILHEVFQAPAKVEARRQARLAKKGEQGT